MRQGGETCFAFIKRGCEARRQRQHSRPQPVPCEKPRVSRNQGLQRPSAEKSLFLSSPARTAAQSVLDLSFQSDPLGLALSRFQGGLRESSCASEDDDMHMLKIFLDELGRLQPSAKASSHKKLMEVTKAIAIFR